MSLLGSSMEDFPEHVMVDILSRLPVKTIIQCKCVSKKWRNIVFDLYFADIQLLRSPAGFMIHHSSQKEMTSYIKPGLLKWVEVEDELDHHNVHHDPAMSLDLNLAPIFQNSQIHPVDSVNGLICLWQFGPKGDNGYICNPITREYMILPRPQCHIEVHKTLAYGFGMGSLTHEYKVILISRGDDSTSMSEAHVYTVGTGQWRSISDVPYHPNRIYGPFLNGHAHWTVVNHNKSGKICAFDFDTETFEEFPSPPPEASIEGSRVYFQSMGVLKGCLCRCDTCDFDFELKVWVMKEYGIKKSWCKEVIIKQQISSDLNWLMWITVHLIECLKDGTIIMVCNDDRLLAYCPRRNTIVNMKMFDGCLNGMAYRPSFHRLQNFENERVHVF